MSKLAIGYDIFDKDGNLQRIEVIAESGEHIIDVLWDPNDAQTNEKRIEFRQWARTMVKRKGYEMAS